MFLSRLSNTLAGLWAMPVRPFIGGRATRKAVGSATGPGTSHLPDSQARFVALLDALPEQARRIYLAHSRDDLTYDAIALQMGITADEVEQEIAYALSLLADALDDA